MREIWKFLVELAIPFILFFAGVGMIAVGFEFELVYLLWAGGFFILLGIIRFIWLLLKDGISLWD